MKLKQHEQQSEKTMTSVVITIKEHSWLGLILFSRLNQEFCGMIQEATKLWYCVVHTGNGYCRGEAYGNGGKALASKGRNPCCPCHSMI